MTKDKERDDAQMKLADVTDEDREAAHEFHREMFRRLMDNELSKTLGEEEGDARPIYQAFARHRRATEARAQGLVEALEACSQWMSDVFPLLGPLKEKWKQADMWSDYDEEVFNRRATLNLQARQALATWRRT